MLPCDVDALIHPDEPLPEEHRLVEAAACDLPLQPEELERWLAPRAPDDGPDAGELIVVSTVPIWVAVDGRYLHASDEGRWRAGRPIGPGRHVLQAGPIGSVHATTAVAFDVAPTGTVVWTLVPTMDGLDLFSCGEDGWGDASEALSGTELVVSQRKWLAREAGVACVDAAPLDAEVLIRNSRSAAAAGWPELATMARSRAFEADPDLTERWQTRTLRGATWSRLAFAGSLAGFVGAEVAYAKADGAHRGVQPWGPRAAATVPLVVSGIQRHTLVRGGQPVPRGALFVGTTLLLTALVAPERWDRWPVGGPGRTLGVSLAIVQALQNELAIHKARKERRQRRKQQEP